MASHTHVCYYDCRPSQFLHRNQASTRVFRSSRNTTIRIHASKPSQDIKTVRAVRLGFKNQFPFNKVLIDLVCRKQQRKRQLTMQVGRNLQYLLYSSRTKNKTLAPGQGVWSRSVQLEVYLQISSSSSSSSSPALMTMIPGKRCGQGPCLSRATKKKANNNASRP
jgi:hypothetical protein